MVSALNSGSSGQGSTGTSLGFFRGVGSHCIKVRNSPDCYVIVHDIFSPELRTFCCVLGQDSNHIVLPSTQVYK